MRCRTRANRNKDLLPVWARRVAREVCRIFLRGTSERHDPLDAWDPAARHCWYRCKRGHARQSASNAFASRATPTTSHEDRSLCRKIQEDLFHSKSCCVSTLRPIEVGQSQGRSRVKRKE